MLRRLYDKTLEAAQGPRATWFLAAVSFAESSFFPIPPDVVLIPMVLADRARAWFLAAVTTITSVLGGLAGYLIGFALFDLIGQPILELYGLSATFKEFASCYNSLGAWIVFIAGLTPIPYKLITIASGVTALNLWVFVAASFAARGMRFFAVAGLIYLFGPTIRQLLDRYFALATIVFVILLIGGFALIKYGLGNGDHAIC
jgi:membrane protein YqaA with SNARE-associated domain